MTKATQPFTDEKKKREIQRLTKDSPFLTAFFKRILEMKYVKERTDLRRMRYDLADMGLSLRSDEIKKELKILEACRYGWYINNPSWDVAPKFEWQYDAKEVARVALGVTEHQPKEAFHPVGTNQRTTILPLGADGEATLILPSSYSKESAKILADFILHNAK